MAELALVRICQLEDLDSLPQLIADLRQTGGEQSQAGSVAGLASKKKYDAPLTDAVAGAAQTVVAHNGKDSVVLPHSNGAMTGNGHAKVEAGESKTDTSTTPLAQIVEAMPIDAAQTDDSQLPGSLDAISIWRQAAEKLGGLAAEKANQASSAAILRPINWSSPFPRSIISANSSASDRKSPDKSRSMCVSLSVADAVEFRYAAGNDCLGNGARAASHNAAADCTKFPSGPLLAGRWSCSTPARSGWKNREPPKHKKQEP